MTYEIYEILVLHYIQGENGEKIKLEDPIVCRNVYDRTFGGTPILLNRMFDEAKEYVLRKAMEEE